MTIDIDELRESMRYRCMVHTFPQFSTGSVLSLLDALDTRDTELAAARAELAALREEREATRQALIAYTEQHGWEHDIYASGDDEVDCPEDDTCECVYFPALNAAMLPKVHP